MRFSNYYGITRTANDDWYDPLLNIDTALGIDPFLVYMVRLQEFATTDAALTDFFNAQFALLARSQGNVDSAHYHRALRNLRLGELEELCLGVTEAGTDGSGAGADLSQNLAAAMMEAITLGLQNPSHFEEASLFREGFGLDRISDITGHIIISDLVAYTQSVCHRHNIAVTPFQFNKHHYDPTANAWLPGQYELPANPYNGRGVLLVPERYLRASPTITAEGFWAYAYENHNDDLRAYFGDEVTRRANRDDILNLARRKPEYVKEYIDVVERGPAEPYDIPKDPLFIVRWDEITRTYVSTATDLRFAIETENDFADAIDVILNRFKHYVEQNGGWDLLRNDNKMPRRERASQRLILGIVMHACEANDIMIAKEPNIGRGPVDFSFAKGYSKRVIVEVKLVRNTKFWDGLEKQLTTYMQAERCSYGYFIAVAYDDDEIKKGREYEVRLRRLNEKYQSDIRFMLVDARIPESASNVIEGPTPGRLA